jgi:hypothetical protein
MTARQFGTYAAVSSAPLLGWQWHCRVHLTKDKSVDWKRMKVGQKMTARHPVAWPIGYGLFLAALIFVLATWAFHFPHQIGGRVFISVVIGGGLGVGNYYSGRRLRDP